MRPSTGFWPIARLELQEVLRSRWLYFCVLLYGVLAAMFVLVGMRESSILGFTGMGRVLMAFSHALLLLLPLLALSATSQTMNRARDDGTLEMLFSHPLSRWHYFLAVSGVRYALLFLPLVLLMLLMAVLGSVRQTISWSFLWRALGISASLLWAFTGLGLLISTVVRNPGRALMYMLLSFAFAVALLDFAVIGLLLKWRLHAGTLFVACALNPLQAARMALLSAAEPELGTLGPIGFYLTSRIGIQALLALGIVWPVALGSLLWSVAVRRFQKDDLV